MEAIVEPLARFARSDIQSRSLVTASYFLYWKKIFMKHVTSTTSFQVLKMNRGEIGQTYMKQERTTKMKREFSHTSRKCFERLHCQLELRFDRSQKKRRFDSERRDFGNGIGSTNKIIGKKTRMVSSSACV